MPLAEADPTSRVLVTGASSGIGAALARGLAARGHPTILVARSADALRELADDLPTDAEILPADLGDDDDLARVRATVEDDDRVVGLVNAAGFGLTGRSADLDDDGAASAEALVRVNVVALHTLTLAAVRAFSARARPIRPAAVLNVSSITAFQPLPGLASYAASKAFVQSFSEAVHAELAGRPVSLTTLSPGLTRTGFADAADTDAFDRAPGFLISDVEDVARAGVEAMVAGRRSVVPGVLNQLSVAQGSLTPRSVLLPLVNRAMDLF